MTLHELIERLEEYRGELGDAEVRLMTQQNWPFENAITGLVSGAEINDTTTKTSRPTRWSTSSQERGQKVHGTARRKF